jgi:hypothetical protein
VVATLPMGAGRDHNPRPLTRLQHDTIELQFQLQFRTVQAGVGLITGAVLAAAIAAYRRRAR